MAEDDIKVIFNFDVKEINFIESDYIIADNDCAFFINRLSILNDVFSVITKYKIKKVFFGKINENDFRIDFNKSLKNIKEINFKDCAFKNIYFHNLNDVKIVF